MTFAMQYKNRSWNSNLSLRSHPLSIVSTRLFRSFRHYGHTGKEELNKKTLKEQRYNNVNYTARVIQSTLNCSHVRSAQSNTTSTRPVTKGWRTIYL